MPELQPLQADHARAVLAFERAGRAYFAGSISDRGDAFFEEFDERFTQLLADQESGDCACYVLVDEDGSIMGRFNLYVVGPGVANLGYRVAERWTGLGITTATVRELCVLASERHALRTLRAVTSHANVASQRVLAKSGFHITGPAGPGELGGRPGAWYERPLDAG